MLSEMHPDAGRSPGEKLEIGGRTYVFGRNQYRCFWYAGPKDGTVTCSKDYPHGSEYPYRVDGFTARTLEKAVEFARKNARVEYERAKAIVERYEAPEKP